MYDLIYLSDRTEYYKAQDELKATFPNAVIEDASDEIHHDRFSFSLEVEEKEYWLKLLEIGLPFRSLSFQLLMLENVPLCKELITQWQANTNSSGG